MRKCRLHGAELKLGNRDIRRGMPPCPPPEGRFEAETELFPNAKSFEMGGCLIPDPDVRQKRVWFCPECRAAEQDWQRGRVIDEFWRA